MYNVTRGLVNSTVMFIKTEFNTSMPKLIILLAILALANPICASESVSSHNVIGTWQVQHISYEHQYQFMGTGDHGEYWSHIYKDDKNLIEAGFWSYNAGTLEMKLIGVEVNGQPFKNHPHIGKTIKSSVLFSDENTLTITYSDKLVVSLIRDIKYDSQQ